jgi:hypothetical protein
LAVVGHYLGVIPKTSLPVGVVTEGLVVAVATTAQRHPMLVGEDLPLPCLDAHGPLHHEWAVW